MMKNIGLILICLMVIGCAAVNRANLTTLQIGMPKEQVKEIMGKPYQIEASKAQEVWYYQTGMRTTYHGDREQVLTPVAFEEGKLIGWGAKFVEKEIDKHEIRIR